jgi:hypothetical protein
MALHLKKNPTKDQALRVAETLRKQESKELEVLLTNPAFSTTMSMDKSTHCFVVLDDDLEPVALCGIVDLADCEIKTGIVWLMSSTRIYEQPIAFYKEIKKLVDIFGNEYERLFNYVAVEAENHQWFIDSLGFALCDEVFEHRDTGQHYFMFEMLTPQGLDAIYAMEATK